jgi:Rps23 Pro-64 3,4-dihydroxylase Tpa1-like proline 4-hydroxylase
MKHEEKWNRLSISILIENRLKEEFNLLQSQYNQSKKSIGYFYIDDLLPEMLINEISEKFPQETNFSFKKNIRERKYVSAQMNEHHQLIEEVLFAFQEENVVSIVAKICEISSIKGDSNLYAGGISMMKYQNYLRPHLDNSHDKNRNLWRVLNLLFYVTPNWKIEDGGTLELWENGLDADPIRISSVFNRLIVMQTDETSWHSVSEVKTTKKVRKCISNYYFSDIKPEKSNNFHITTFRNPKNKYSDLILKLDNVFRSSLRKVFKKGIVQTKHFYDKDTSGKEG